MGRSEIGVSEEEKRETSKAKNQSNRFFSKTFHEVLAKPASEFGVSERENAETSKLPNRADEKISKNFSESGCNSALFPWGK